MPFLARVNGQEKTPAVTSSDEDIICRKCEEQLSLVKEHTRDGSWVSSHFRHRPDSSSDCGGESPTHEKMKSIAADRLKHAYDIENLYVDTRKIEHKLPDVLATFENAQVPMGNGIAVECQYRNKGKDREETEDVYLRNGFTTIWLEEDAFDLDNLFVDLSEAEWVPPWPNAVPESEQWEGYEYEFHRLHRWNLEPETVGSGHYQFRLTRGEVGRRRAMELWREDEGEPPLIGSPSREVEMTFPPDAVEGILRDFWFEASWGSRFRGTHERFLTKHRRESSRAVEATVPLARWLADEGEIYRFNKGFRSDEGRIRPSETMMRRKITKYSLNLNHHLVPESLMDELIDLSSSETMRDPDIEEPGPAREAPVGGRIGAACNEGEHDFVRYNGSLWCDHCNLSAQSLNNWLDHDLFNLARGTNE